MTSVVLWVLMIVSPNPDFVPMLLLFSTESLCETTRKMSMDESVKPGNNLTGTTAKCVKMKLISPEGKSV